MKKTFSTFIAIALMLFVASCKKEAANEPDVQSNGIVFTCTIVNDAKQNAPAANPDGFSPMTHIDRYFTCWNDNDEIAINGYTFQAKLGTLTESGNTVSYTMSFEGNNLPQNFDKYKVFHALYPASIQAPLTPKVQNDTNVSSSANTGTLPATYTYDPDNTKMPLYARGTTSSLNFHNVCAIMRLVLPANVARIEVTSTTNALNGAFAISETTSGSGVYYAAMTATTPSDDNKKLTITPEGTSATFDASKFVYIPIPVSYGSDGNPASIGNVTINIYNSSNTNTPLDSKTLNNFTPAVNTIYSGNFDSNYLPKRFSVCSKKKVYFTKGNLYYTGSSFALETNQADFSSWNAGHVSHFYFRNTLEGMTSASLPSKADVDSMLYDQLGLTDTYILTECDWYYLLHDRPAAVATAPTVVTLNNVSCLIVAYDGFTSGIPSYSSFNDYTNAGFLVLPLCGYRMGTTMYPNPENDTRYWASDHTTGTNNGKAHYCNITSGGYVTITSATIGTNSDFACAIRLARIAQ